MPNVVYTFRSVPISICPRSQHVGESAFERVVFATFFMSLSWGTALACISGSRLVFAEKHFCGYIWVTQALLAAFALALSKRGPIKFPILIWLPWLMWITVRCDFGDFGTVQRTIMLIAGPFVGTAASTLIVKREDLEWLIGTFRVIVPFSAAVFLVYMLRMLPPGIWYSGPASVMTLCLAASYCAPYVYDGNWKHILLWLCCFSICTLSGTRTATAVCLLTLPLSPAPKSLQRRLVVLLIACLLTIFVFSLPNMKEKMSKSGQASLIEIIGDWNDLYTSGRSYMWPLYLDEAYKKPFLGAGGNASCYFGVDIAGSSWTHPHNEYIRVFFDYGAVGLLFLGVSMLYTILYTFRRIRDAKCAVLRDAWTISCGGFISMCLLAITDNVILYAAFFGCLLFCILGAAYGLSAMYK